MAHIIESMRRLGLSLRLMAWLFILSMVALAFEVVGIATLLPIFELLRAGGSLEQAERTGTYWQTINAISAATGIPVSLGSLLTISFVFLVLRQAANYMSTCSKAAATRSVANKIRQRAFLGFLRARSDFQEHARIGEMAGDLTVELSRGLSAAFALIQAASRAVQMLVYVIGLFALSIPMTLLSLASIGLLGFLSRPYLAAVKQRGQAITEANVDVTSFIVERLRHARLIRLSGTEKAETRAFADLSNRHSVETLQQSIVGARLALLPEPLMLGFGYLILYIGSQVIGLSLDRLALFVIVLIRLLPLLRGVIADYNNIVGKWPSFEKVDRLIKTLLGAAEGKGGSKVLTSLDSGISYEHISFAYTGDGPPALSEVTVSLPAHRMSALVGPSGSGKSTFVDLLPRLREPTGGNILLDGTKISDFSLESLRGAIAFVPQQPQIFNISASEHIRYGKDDATDAEIREAARLAGALPFIEALPEGFDTLLGDGGTRLSGGQRQRLDIARALVRRAPILILDEPTSALDAEAEWAFREALQTLRSETDLTIVVIAHRLSTIADAERIVVLRGGKVEAVGSHERLLAAGGWYAEAYKMQMGALSAPQSAQIVA